MDQAPDGVKEVAARARVAGVAWDAVWILYVREVRAALRDRTIVVNVLLVPVVLYPFLLWVAFSASTFVRGQTADLTARVAAFGLERLPELRRALEAEPRVVLVPVTTPSSSADALSRGDLDAVLETVPGVAGREAGVRLTWLGSRGRSAAARTRLAALFARLRESELSREAARRGLDGAPWTLFTLEERNAATGREMGRSLLGLLLPLLFVAMVAMGCFYAAVDTTAGERERSTWETLAASPAPRPAIAAAKLLHVATFGLLAGSLNVAAMLATMAPVAAPVAAGRGEGLDFSVPWAAVPVLLVAALLLALLLAAAMLPVAAFARTFKEGQAQLSPFALVAFLPIVLLVLPGVRLSPLLALVPVVNVALVVREAMTGVFRWGEIAIAAAASVVSIALSHRLASLLVLRTAGAGGDAGAVAPLLRRLRARDGRSGR